MYGTWYYMLKFRFIINSIVIFLLMILAIFCMYSVNADRICKDFDESMGDIGTFKNTYEYKIFKKFYSLRNPCVKSPDIENDQNLKIPKKIHQIWLGPKKIPKVYVKFSETWKNLHPTWEYKLWTEEDIREWKFATKELFDEASSYQEKSDILRYEILNKYGGLYVDFDYAALQKFDNLHYLYDFYGGIERNGVYYVVPNSIIGSKPNNQILIETLSQIKLNWNSQQIKDYKKSISEGKNKVLGLAVMRTMLPLNDSVLKYVASNQHTIIFPITYLSVYMRDSWFYKVCGNIKWCKEVVRHYKPLRYPHAETMGYQLIGEKRVIQNLLS